MMFRPIAIAALLAMTTFSIAPAQMDPPQESLSKESPSKSWEAQPRSQPKPRDNRQQRDAQPRESRPREREREPRREEETPALMRRFHGAMNEYRREAEHIIQSEHRLEERRQILQGEDLSEPRRERLQRIVRLQQDLVTAEKEDFIERFRTTVQEGRENLEKHMEEMNATGEDQRLHMLSRAHERLVKLQDAATDFDSLIENFRDGRGRWEQDPRRDSRTNQIERELQMLQARIDRLYEELDFVDERQPLPRGMNPWEPPPPPPPHDEEPGPDGHTRPGRLWEDNQPKGMPPPHHQRPPR